MAANLLPTERDALAAPPHIKYLQSCSSPRFRDLMQIKKRIVGPLLIVSLGFFFCLTLLAGFARPLMSTKLAGSLNIGFCLILLAYLVCWITALLYVRAANNIFDEKVVAMVGVEHARSNQS